MDAKLPPSSTDAERGVLGSLLIDPDAVLKISDIVTKDDFYDGQHGAIFDAVIKLFSAGKPIDILTVGEKLDSEGNLEAVGGNSYLAELTGVVPTSANVFEYAQIVKTKSVLRRLISAGTDIVTLGYDEAEEINILLEKAEQNLFGVTQSFIKNKLTHIRDILDMRYEEYSELQENADEILGSRVKTGFKGMDDKFQGLRGGDMIILAARPSMGKTALGLNIAQFVAREKPVAFFSLEMGKEQIVDRMVCAEMGIDSWKLQKGELSDGEFSQVGEALSRLSESKLFIDDSPGMNLLEIKSKCRRLKMESGLDFIVIDYLQLIHGTNPNNRVQEIGEISRGIKTLARELDVPIVALSQLSRAVESRATKEPVLSDLRESGSIEQDADIVMMIYREDYYMQDMPESDMNKGLTTVFVRKNRNGPVGQVSLKFDAKFMKFHEIDTSHDPFA